MPSSLPSKFQLIMTDSFEFFVRHFRQIASLCLPFMLAAALVEYFLMLHYSDNEKAFFVSMAAFVLVYPIYTAAMIQLMARRARNEHPGNRELIVAAIPQWGPLLAVKLFVTLVIFFGLSMLIVPGVWIAVRLLFAECYLVLFNLHPAKALEKSITSTRGHFAPILMLLLITYPPILLVLVTFANFIESVTDNLFITIMAVTIWSLTLQFCNVVIFRTFMEVIKDQSDIAVLG